LLCTAVKQMLLIIVKEQKLWFYSTCTFTHSWDMVMNIPAKFIKVHFRQEKTTGVDI